jgi:nucleoside-diphosphate kinase
LFYDDKRGADYFDNLTRFMASEACQVMILAKPGAVNAWRTLIGNSTDLDALRKSKPQSLRARFATTTTMNAVHGSSDAAKAAVEINFFFPQLNIEAIPVRSATVAM